MKQYTFVLILSVLSLASYSQEKEEKDSETVGYRDVTDTVYSFYYSPAEIISIPTVIRVDEHGTKKDTAYIFNNLLQITKVEITNHTSKKKKSVWRIMYQSAKLPSEQKELVLDSAQIKGIQEFFGILENDKNELSEIRYALSNGIKIGRYARGTQPIYFLVVGDIEYYFWDKRMFLGLRKHFQLPKAEAKK